MSQELEQRNSANMEIVAEDSNSMQLTSSYLPSSQPNGSESDVIMIGESSPIVEEPNPDDSSSQLNSSIIDRSETGDDETSANKSMSDSTASASAVPKVKMSKQEREVERKRRLEEKKMAEEERQRKRIEREKIQEEKRLEKQQKLEEKKRVAEEQRREAEEKRRLIEEKRKEREEKKRLEDEEKAKKAEEKQKLIDEQQMKHKKLAEKFIGFFQKRSSTSKMNLSMDDGGIGETGTVSGSAGKFFGVYLAQRNERVAPMVPQISRDNFVMGAFDSVVVDQNETQLYLGELRQGVRKPFVYSRQAQQSAATKAGEEEPEDESNVVAKKVYKAKLLQFVENVRPPYFGTWRKRSDTITGRRPMVKDSGHFDYDVDSDDEWEEEEKGESIRDSDSEKSDNEDNDYELDDFFVPHGHLSDDENQEEDIADVELMPDGQKKRKLLTKEKILIEERTKKLKRLVPKTIGCLWMEDDDFINKAKFRDFEKHRVCFLNEI